MASISQNNKIFSSWDNYSFIKKSAIVLSIGTVAGAFSYFSATYIAQACHSNQNGLGDYLCLRSRTFFEPTKLAPYLNPIIGLCKGITEIAKSVTSFIPSFDFIPSNCEQLRGYISTLMTDKTYKNSRQFGMDVFAQTYTPCCKIDNSSECLGYAFGEEIVNRTLFQGLVFPALQKIPSLFKLCGRVRPKKRNNPPSIIEKIITNQFTRIIAGSLIFAFMHSRSDDIDDQVLPNFYSSLIFGILFEKFGLFYGTIAATNAHFVSNLFGNNDQKNWCVEQISDEILNLRTYFK